MRGLVVFALTVGCGQPGGATGDDSGGDVDAHLGGDASSDGAVVPVCPPGRWCSESAPIAATTRLFAVHARDAGDVLAVGDGGTIIRRRQQSWIVMDSGTVENLRGVWSAGELDAWAVGEGGTVLRWNGTVWAQVEGVLDIDYNGVWGTSATDVWLIGTSTVQRWNGSTWTKATIPGTLLGISGSSPSDVWIAGESTYLRHYTGTWMTVMPGAGSTNFAIEVIAPDDVWASAPGVGALHYTSAGWAQPGGAVFVDFHAVAPNDVWAVTQTTTGHWDGGTWTLATPPGVSQSLWGVAGSGAHVWVVGSGATIQHRN